MEDFDQDANQQDDSSTSNGEEQMIPQSRFKEVYGKMKELEREISGLREAKKEGGLSEEQTKELQAKTYLKNLLKETLAEERSRETQEEKEELAQFKDEVNELLSIHTDVKRDDFLTFLEEEGDDYSSLAAAMRGYKKGNEKEKAGGEKAKQDLSRKPKLPSSEGSGGSTYDPDKDKGKSLWQIAQEAAAEFSKK